MLNRTNSTRGGKPEGVRQARGAISDLSHSSRKRLMQLCGSIDIEAMGLPDFVTLTYPGEWPDDPDRWKRDLRAMWMRFSRRFPEYVAVWRIEPQQRGAPHYHLAVWNAADLRGAAGKEWLSENWYEVVGSGDLKHLAAGTSVEPVESWRKWISYVSKYIAKVGKNGKKEVFDYEIGRYWGIRNKAGLRIKIQVEKVSADKFVRVRRVLKKMMDANKRRRGERVHKFNGNIDVSGLWCYLSNVTAVKLLGLFENEEPLPF